MTHALVRLFGVVRKEIVEILRQPGLLIALVVGPLAILLLFGSGVRSVDPAVASLFVAPEDDPEVAEVVRRYADSQSERLTVEGVVQDRDAAMGRLRRGEVELVVIVPSQPLERIEGGERATIEVFHSLIDPLEAQAMQLFTRGAVNDLNDLLLDRAIQETQSRGETALEQVQVARDRLSAADRGTFGAAEDVGQLRQDLDAVAEQLDAFVNTDSAIIVAPLEGESSTIGGQLEVSQFYAPAVVALILQHLTLTFIALSVSREREQGSTELFAVSPLRPVERVVGKLVAYLLIGGLLAVVLIAAVALVLGAPLRGGIAPVAVVLALELLASIGLGFLLSHVAKRTLQVVQGAMLLLLLSVFFGGLLLSPERLFPWARPVGWILPMSHALELLRDSMLRGRELALLPLAALAVMAVGLTLLGAILATRSERRA